MIDVRLTRAEVRLYAQGGQLMYTLTFNFDFGGSLSTINFHKEFPVFEMSGVSQPPRSISHPSHCTVSCPGNSARRPRPLSTSKRSPGYLPRQTSLLCLQTATKQSSTRRVVASTRHKVPIRHPRPLSSLCSRTEAHTGLSWSSNYAPSSRWRRAPRVTIS